MLDRYQFEVLRECAKESGKTPREIAAGSAISLDSIIAAHREMTDGGYIDENDRLTEKGWTVLSPCKADNAVILAAGMATRFAPLSFERPKAMFEVRGEILIERLIRQLREAGVNDISVVVGYMKESFFYLEDEFGVKIIVNNEYANRNNHSSVWCARESLRNTYIVSSDQYLACNPFEEYCFTSTCSAMFSEGRTDEQVLVLDDEGVIIGSDKSGVNGYYMQGPAYFDCEFSQRYLEILAREYDKPETANKLWEQVFVEHVDELHMAMRVFEPGSINKFDYITDLAAFDRDFFTNVDSRILDNICNTLECTREDITEVVPIKAGLTNLSTLFAVNGEKFIYRHPGNGTEEIVKREAEALALTIARDLGLDDTFIYEDSAEGWKISRYIEGCSELDYGNKEQVERALQMARVLHTSGKTSPWSFDFYDEGIKIAETLREINYPLPKDFDALRERMSVISRNMRAETGEPVLCHNDFYGPNFLVRGDEMWLIDWEYAAMGDPACDIGNFVAQGSGYSVEEAIGILPLYYGRDVTASEARHCVAAVAVVGWYWYVWAMYKEAMGNPVGEWLYVWYRAARQFGDAAEELYAIDL